MKRELTYTIKLITADSQEKLEEAVKLYCSVALLNKATIVSIKYSDPEEGKKKRVLFATITTFK